MPKKIAVVYDWIDKWGGVERVLLALHEMFPQAEVYTSYFNVEKAGWAKDFKIKTSFIQRLPTLIKNSRIFSLPFYPYAFESLNLKDYDLVISVTSSFAKSVITRPETKHICYLLTPTRFLWVTPEEYTNLILRFIGKRYIGDLKKWDFVSAQRPDKIISLSQTVADRCLKYYKRDSEVLYPPFDTEYWGKVKNQNASFSHSGKPAEGEARPESDFNDKTGFWSRYAPQNDILKKEFYLVVSRLEPYKKVDLAIKTFNRLPELNLLVVGKGSQAGKLKRIAGKNITFVDYVSDEDLGYLYSQAQALIMPQEEDFGFVSLEAQFFGCPVIAYGKGGAKETIIENKTGIFFTKQNKSSLREALERFHTMSYNLRSLTERNMQKSIERFTKDKFTKGFQNLIVNY